MAADDVINSVKAKLEAAKRAGRRMVGCVYKRTRVDETDRLCEHDHDLKTFHGWALVAGTGKRPMVPPHDPRHPKNKPPPDR